MGRLTGLSFVVLSLAMADFTGGGKAGATETSVYKWTDEQGKVHYGDRPPREAKPEELRFHTAPGRSGAAVQQFDQNRLLEVFRDERKAREAESAKREAARAAKLKHASNCELARERLSQYKSANYLYAKTEDGNRQVLTDEARAKLLEELAVKINQYCK